MQQGGGKTNLINFRYKFNFLLRAEKYLLNWSRLTASRVSRWRRLSKRSGLTKRGPAWLCQGSVTAHKKLPLFPRLHPQTPVCVCQNRDSGSVQRRIGTSKGAKDWINSERFIAICHPSDIFGGCQNRAAH